MEQQIRQKRQQSSSVIRASDLQIASRIDRSGKEEFVHAYNGKCKKV
jgi:hypothetical protein